MAKPGIKWSLNPEQEEQMKKLASQQWSDTMIADFFNVDRTTLNKYYHHTIDQARNEGKGKLIQLQWMRAAQGSDRMIIHMSQQYLNQHQKLDISRVPDEILKPEIERRLEAASRGELTSGGQPAEIIDTEYSEEERDQLEAGVPELPDESAEEVEG